MKTVCWMKSVFLRSQLLIKLIVQIHYIPLPLWRLTKNLERLSPNNQAPDTLWPSFSIFFFKVLAVLLYLCFHLFYDNFILVFVACVLALSFDFWTVKNVSGRLLVGLRWWNEIKEDGSNIWVFESKPPNRTVDSGDSMVFWAALYLTPLIWCLLGIMSMFQPKWLLIVVVAIILSGANVVGYWKCQKDAKQKIQNFTTAFIANRL